MQHVMDQSQGAVSGFCRSAAVVGLAAAATATAAISAYRYRETLFACVTVEKHVVEPPRTTGDHHTSCRLSMISRALSPQRLNISSFWPETFKLGLDTIGKAGVFSAVEAKHQNAELGGETNEAGHTLNGADDPWPSVSDADGDLTANRRCDDSDIDSAMSGDEGREKETDQLCRALEAREDELMLSTIEANKLLLGIEGDHKDVLTIPEDFSFEIEPACIQCESPRMTQAHCGHFEDAASTEVQPTKAASKPNLLRRSLQRLSHKMTHRHAKDTDQEATTQLPHKKKKKPFSSMKSAFKKLKAGFHPPTAGSYRARISAQ